MLGLPPFLTLRLLKALSSIVKQSSKNVTLKTSLEASIIRGLYLIRLEVFYELLKRDGFSEIY